MDAFLAFLLEIVWGPHYKQRSIKRLHGYTPSGIWRLWARSLKHGRESLWNPNLPIALRMAQTITHAHGLRKSFPGTSKRIWKFLKPSNCSTEWTTPPHYPLKLIEVTYAIGAGCRMNQIKLSLERSYICIN